MDSALPATALADGRFRLTRVVGEGGMGVVYEAFDRDVRSPVALKMMRSTSGESVLRLKSEFRSLRDVRHPNLVRLGELFADPSRCFFTMELVEGVDLLSHVINPEALRRRAAERPTHTGGFTIREEATPERTVWDADTLRLEVPFDEDKLRAALRQVALALAALHQAGKIHRDVKPTNVLITADGRAVLLDLGLASERGTPTPEGQIEGTVEYMAPEQTSGAASEPAADLYALGAILYEALTGRPPFVGDVIDVITQKRTIDPLPPAMLYGGIPPDLDELCISLLARDPARRPSALDVAQGMASGAWAPRPVTSPRPELPFIGRAAELAALSRAYADSARRPVAVLVSGESGLGKTRVLTRFANDVRATGSLIFAGRCHAQESVSFRAFDGIADALSRYLLALPPDEREDLLPADVTGLARLFRVFERLAPPAGGPSTQTGHDVRARRRRAFAALHELLTNLAARGPLTLIIDDLHWIDSDSLMLFEGIMANNPPPLLLVGMVRPVRRVKQLEEGLVRLGLEVRQIDLQPLDHHHSIALARSILPAADRATLERLAHTCQGSPHFLEQMAAAVASGDSAGETLEQLVTARVDALADGPRLVLELVCVAAVSFEQATIGRAAGLSRTELNSAISELEERRLVRISGGRRQDLVEPYHDQIRQTARARLTPEQIQNRHRALAEALERRSASPWLVVHHWLGASEPARAAPFALAAAVASQHELAARHVARLCAAAIELLPESDAAYRHLCRALATALANAGQGGEAAEWYLRAAAAAPESEPVEALELRRLAGDHLLRCGRIDEGMAVMSDVLAAVGVTLPRGARRALVSLAWRRARLKLRTWRGAEAPRRIDAAARLRADVCLSCGTSLAVIDAVAGMSLHARGLDEALRIGDRDRIALGLALEAGFSALPGTGSAERTERLIGDAERAVAEVTSPLPAATLAWVRGMAAYLQGRFRDAARLNDAAARQFAETCPGRIWEQSQAELFAAWAVSHLGDLSDLSARIGDLDRVARWSDDRYVSAQVRAGNGALPWLASDRPDEAEARIDEAATTWTQSGFHVQHVLELWARCEIDLYRGDGARAWRRMHDAWPALEESLLLRLQHTMITANDLRARAAIASGDRAHLDDAERCARRVLQENAPWGNALATARLAAITAARGDQSAGVRQLNEAAGQLEATDLALHAATVRLRLASLAPGPLERSPAYLILTNRGVKRPERWLGLYAPWRTLPAPAPR